MKNILVMGLPLSMLLIVSACAGGGGGHSPKTSPPPEAPEPTVSESALTLSEAGGATATYTIVLVAAPAADVVITVTSSDSDAVTVNKSDGTAGGSQELTFTPSDWSTPQTVTVAAVEDGDARDESVTITHQVTTGDSAGYTSSLSIASVTVEVDDDEERPTLSESALTLTEGGTSATYTIVLTVAPASDVVITVASSDGNAVTVNKSGGTGGGSQELTFTPSDWSTPQTVTVAPVNDGDARDESVMITHRITTGDSGNYTNELDIHPVEVTVDDDEERPTLSESALTLTENGTSATYTIVLTVAPASDVVIMVASSDGDAVTVNKSGGTAGNSQELTFTTSNWSTPQTVTVAPVEDDDAADESVMITHKITTGDSGNYTNELDIHPVEVTVDDDEPLVEVAMALSEPTETDLVEAGGPSGVGCDTANGDGSYNVPNDWVLKPSGLTPGSKFRLLFVTSTTRDASSNNIADYNTHVQNAAKNGRRNITNSCGDLFKVIGSTSAVNARANTDTDTGDTNAAIYWLKGDKVADDYADFYDGTWAARNTGDGRTETGAVNTATNVWTGTENNGDTSDAELGNSDGDGNVKQGRLGTNDSPLVLNDAPKSEKKPFYALSPVFEVTAINTNNNVFPTMAEFTLTLTTALSADERVEFYLKVSGTAKEVHDFEFRLKSGTGLNTGVSLLTRDRFLEGLKFEGAGAQEATLEVVVINDVISEHSIPESFTVALGRGARAKSGTDEDFTLTIGDNDQTVTLGQLGSLTVPEGETLQIKLKVDKSLSWENTIGIIGRSGSATAGDDFPSERLNVILPANSLEAVFTFPTIKDTVDEENETFMLAIDESSLPVDVIRGNPHQFTITIRE